MFEVFHHFRLLPCYKSRVSPLSKKQNCMWRCVVISWQGKIIFHESNEFWTELQTTIPDGQMNNSEVKATYSSFDNETILLQVVSASLYNEPFYSDLCKTCFIYQEILLWLLHILVIQLEGVFPGVFPLCMNNFKTFLVSVMRLLTGMGHKPIA